MWPLKKFKWLSKLIVGDRGENVCCGADYVREATGKSRNKIHANMWSPN